MLLIISYADDPCYQKIARRLDERGVSHALFDTRDFPRRTGLTLSCSVDQGAEGTLHLPGQDVPVQEIDTIYFRRSLTPVPAESLRDRDARRYVRDELTRLLDDLYAQLEVRWFPAAPDTIHLAQLKTRQLRIAEELGLDVPESLVTSRSERVLELYDRRGGEIISKLVGATAFSRVHAEELVRYTDRVARTDLGFARAVAACPILFQAYVDKVVEVRATVVGDQVFAAEIHSQATNHTRTDWRRYDRNRPRYLPHRLPDDVARRCVALVKRLGLLYAAIDLVVTAKGGHTFLEANPVGEYNWIEEYSGLAISDAIADHLAGARA